MLIAVKEVLIPGSIPFLILALIPGTALLYRRADAGRWGRRWIAALLLMYWLFSTPVTASWLVETLTPVYAPLQDAQAAHGATAIVLLGAGAEHYRSRGRSAYVITRPSALRALETARVYELMDRPWVIVSGGVTYDAGPEGAEATIIGAELLKLGVAQDRLVLDLRSVDTHGHSIYVPPLLRDRGVDRFVLVTSQQHMRRALRVFQTVGMAPVPSVPELFATPPSWRSWLSYVPSRTALDVSRELMYDALGMGYYWLRGWI